MALAIRNAANEAETVGGDLLTITASITVDTQRLMEVAQSGGDFPGGMGGQGGNGGMDGGQFPVQPRPDGNMEMPTLDGGARRLPGEMMVPEGNTN